MNKINLNLITILLVVASISLVSFAYSYYTQVSNLNYRTFSVSGEGKAIATPDVAQFSFTIFTRGELDVAESERANSTRVSEVISYLKDNGIKTEDIKTDIYSVEPRYTQCTSNRVCPPDEIEGYTVSQSNTVKVRDFSIVSELISGVTASNVDNVSQLSFVVDDRLEYENIARAEAIEVAKEKAKSTAKAAGVRVGKLVSVYEDYYGGYYADTVSYNVGRGGGEASAEAPKTMIGSVDSIGTVDDSVVIEEFSEPEVGSAEISPGTSEIVIRVTLNYAIK